MPGSEGLDSLTKTFTADRSFCDGLAETQGAWHIAKMLLFARWTSKYLNPIQDELCGMVEQHFSCDSQASARFWTATLSGAVGKDIRLVPYLSVRGLASEAGFAIRRSLENVGLLSHLWHTPDKAVFLSDPDSPEFLGAFIREPEKKKAAELKQKGIQKRFARCLFGKHLSDLYKLFSSYTVHGASPNQLIMTQLMPTIFSCGLINRPEPPAVADYLQLLSQACQILCTEIISIHGTYGKMYGVTPSPGGEGGFLLYSLLEDGEMAKWIEGTLVDLSWNQK